MDKTVKRLAIILLLLAGTVSAKYAPREMFTIPWGNGSNELKASPGYTEGIVSDSTDYEDEPGIGPTELFVDGQENVIISSYEYMQIKGFDKSGNLIFDFSSADYPEYYNICPGKPTAIYVDSLMRLYIVSFPRRPLIPVVNYDGTVAERLLPYSDSNASISMMGWNAEGIITFFCREFGYITYSNNQFVVGGSGGVLADNGYYYAAFIDDSTGAFYINRYSNPDKWENPQTSNISEVSLVVDSAYSAELLYGGDGNLLFAYMDYYKGIEEILGVFIFDLNYNVIAEIDFPPPEGKYLFTIKPFIGNDNSIYESRIRDDGLHVIKWTKQ
jgi:hypothetical protein